MNESNSKVNKSVQCIDHYYYDYSALCSCPEIQIMRLKINEKCYSLQSLIYNNKINNNFKMNYSTIIEPYNEKLKFESTKCCENALSVDDIKCQKQLRPVKVKIFNCRSKIKNDLFINNNFSTKLIKKYPARFVRYYMNKYRHYSSLKKKIKPEEMKIYSIGDYLRHVILEDLTSTIISDKTKEQIAEDRYRKVKTYINYRSRILDTLSKAIYLNNLNKSQVFPEIPKNKKIKKFQMKRKNLLKTNKHKNYNNSCYIYNNQNYFIKNEILDFNNRRFIYNINYNGNNNYYYNNIYDSQIRRNQKKNGRFYLNNNHIISRSRIISQENYKTDMIRRQLFNCQTEIPLNFMGENRINSTMDNNSDKCLEKCEKRIQENSNFASDYFHQVYEFLKERRKEESRANVYTNQRIQDKNTGEEALVTPVGVSGSAVTCRLYIKNNNNYNNNNNNHHHNNNNNNNNNNINISKNYTNKYNNIHDKSNNENCQEKQEEKINPENHESFCRLQLRDVSSKQDKHYFKPPIPVKYKVNAQDISKYFDYPNKVHQVRDVVNEIIETKVTSDDCNKSLDENSLDNMGSNLSRHHGKSLTAGRRTQSSGNLCDPKGKIASHVSKMFVPCSNSSTQERYKFSGSLPNNLDNDKDTFIKNLSDNNNVISDTISGNLGGTLPYKKPHYEVQYHDRSTVNFDLVKYRSQSSLEGDPWEYHQNNKVDLVRCKHGNYNIVPKNQHVDTIPTTMEPVEGRYEPVYSSNNRICSHHNGTDYPMDFTMGTLPKRRIDPKWCDPASIQTIPPPTRDSENPERVDRNVFTKELQAPKPPARLDQIKYQTPEKNNLSELKRTGRPVGSEHQADQGYASERSPEEEHPPSLAEPVVFNTNSENTFRVTLQKTSRGLGLSVSGGGTAGPIRVKRLFPQQPAALSNKLQPGDILLAANGIPLSGLTNYEALEVLRTTSSTVELLVCRLPGETSITPPGAPPTPPARREPLPQPRVFNPIPPLHIEPCGEFDIEMTKVGGSLGFTLRKVDSSALGHYVRALVREPALSDGRIQPGDKIVAVDGAPLSPMSHEEAVALLRQCGPKVKLRLYRDLAQTPVSALSPTESDHPLRPPRTSLRKEAVDMLCDLAIRKLSPSVSDGLQPVNNPQHAPSTSSSPRRLRRPPSRTTLLDDKSDNNDQSLTNESLEEKFYTNNDNAAIDHDIHDIDCVNNSMKLSRPNFLNLSATNEKSELQKTLKDSEYNETITNDNINNCRINLNGGMDYYGCHERNMLLNDLQDNNLPSEPVSMPPIVSFSQTQNDETFSYKNPAYQSVNPTCSKNDNDNGKTKDKASSYSSDQNIAGKIPSAEDPVGCKSLLKWKGVMFAPDDKTDNGENFKEKENSRNNNFLPKENIHKEDCEVFMVELTRGWNSRLGFSLQPTPDNKSTIISMVHPDSVAAKDGRLKQGDILIMINDESVENTPTSEIIDLLRKIRGSIGITVARKKYQKTDKSLEKVN